MDSLEDPQRRLTYRSVVTSSQLRGAFKSINCPFLSRRVPGFSMTHEFTQSGKLFPTIEVVVERLRGRNEGTSEHVPILDWTSGLTSSTLLV